MRKRHIGLFQRENGEEFLKDMHEQRLWRCRQRLGHWADLVNSELGQYKLAGLTFTYDGKGTLGRGAHQWQAGDISEATKKIRDTLGAKLLALAWVAEVQANGNVHYHVLLAVKPGTYVPMPDKCGWWELGMTSLNLKVRGVGYLLKYAGKEAQKDFNKYPKGLRLFAVYFREQGLKLKLRLVSLDLLDKAILSIVGMAELRWLSCYRPYFRDSSPARFVAALTEREAVEYALARGL